MRTSSARACKFIKNVVYGWFTDRMIAVSMRFQPNYAFPEYRESALFSFVGGTAQQLFNATIIVRIPEQPVR